MVEIRRQPGHAPHPDTDLGTPPPSEKSAGKAPSKKSKDKPADPSQPDLLAAGLAAATAMASVTGLTGLSGAASMGMKLYARPAKNPPSAIAPKTPELPTAEQIKKAAGTLGRVGLHVISPASASALEAGLSLYQAGKAVLVKEAPALFAAPKSERQQAIQETLWKVTATRLTFPFHAMRATGASLLSTDAEKSRQVFSHVGTINDRLEALSDDLKAGFNNPRMNLQSVAQNTNIVLKGAALLELLGGMDFSDAIIHRPKDGGEPLPSVPGKNIADNLHARVTLGALEAISKSDESTLEQSAKQTESLADFHQAYRLRQTMRHTLTSYAHAAAWLGDVPLKAVYREAEKPVAPEDPVGLADDANRAFARADEISLEEHALFRGVGGSDVSADELDTSCLARFSQKVEKENKGLGIEWQQHVAGIGEHPERDLLYASDTGSLKPASDQWRKQFDQHKPQYDGLMAAAKSEQDKSASVTLSKKDKTEQFKALEGEEITARHAYVDALNRNDPKAHDVNLWLKSVQTRLKDFHKKDTSDETLLGIETTIGRLTSEISEMKRAGNQWHDFNFFRGTYHVSTATAERLLGEYHQIRSLYQSGGPARTEALKRLEVAQGGTMQGYWSSRLADVAEHRHEAKLFVADIPLTMATMGVGGKVASATTKALAHAMLKKGAMSAARGRAVGMLGHTVNAATFHNLGGISNDLVFHHALGWKAHADYDPTNIAGNLWSVANVGVMHKAGQVFARRFAPIRQEIAQRAAVFGENFGKNLAEGVAHVTKLASVDVPVMLGMGLAQNISANELPHDFGEMLHHTVADALAYGTMIGGHRAPAADVTRARLERKVATAQKRVAALGRLPEGDPRRARLDAAGLVYARHLENLHGYRLSLNEEVLAQEKTVTPATQTQQDVPKLSLSQSAANAVQSLTDSAGHFVGRLIPPRHVLIQGLLLIASPVLGMTGGGGGGSGGKGKGPDNKFKATQPVRKPTGTTPPGGADPLRPQDKPAVPEPVPEPVLPEAPVSQSAAPMVATREVSVGRRKRFAEGGVVTPDGIFKSHTDLAVEAAAALARGETPEPAPAPSGLVLPKAVETPAKTPTPPPMDAAPRVNRPGRDTVAAKPFSVEITENQRAQIKGTLASLEREASLKVPSEKDILEAEIKSGLWKDEAQAYKNLLMGPEGLEATYAQYEALEKKAGSLTPEETTRKARLAAHTRDLLHELERSPYQDWRDAGRLLGLYEHPELRLRLDAEMQEGSPFQPRAQALKGHLATLAQLKTAIETAKSQGKNTEVNRLSDRIRDKVAEINSNPISRLFSSMPLAVQHTYVANDLLARHDEPHRSDHQRALATLEIPDSLPESVRRDLQALKEGAKKAGDDLEAIRRQVEEYEALDAAYAQNPNSKDLKFLYDRGAKIAQAVESWEKDNAFLTAQNIYEHADVDYRNALVSLDSLAHKLSRPEVSLRLVATPMQDLSPQTLANLTRQIRPPVEEMMSFEVRVPKDLHTRDVTATALEMAIGNSPGKLREVKGSRKETGDGDIFWMVEIDGKNAGEKLHVRVHVKMEGSMVAYASGQKAMAPSAETEAVAGHIFLADLKDTPGVPAQLVKILGQIPVTDPAAGSRQGSPVDRQVQQWANSVFSSKVPNAEKNAVMASIAKLHAQAINNLAHQIDKIRTSQDAEALSVEWGRKKALLEKLYTGVHETIARKSGPNHPMAKLVHQLKAGVDLQGQDIEQALTDRRAALAKQDKPAPRFHPITIPDAEFNSGGQTVMVPATRALAAREVLRLAAEGGMKVVRTEEGGQIWEAAAGSSAARNPPDPLQNPMLDTQLQFLGWSLKTTHKPDGGILVEIRGPAFRLPKKPAPPHGSGGSAGGAPAIKAKPASAEPAPEVKRTADGTDILTLKQLGLQTYKPAAPVEAPPLSQEPLPKTLGELKAFFKGTLVPVEESGGARFDPELAVSLLEAQQNMPALHAVRGDGDKKATTLLRDTPEFKAGLKKLDEYAERMLGEGQVPSQDFFSALARMGHEFPVPKPAKKSDIVDSNMQRLGEVLPATQDLDAYLTAGPQRENLLKDCHSEDTLGDRARAFAKKAATLGSKLARYEKMHAVSLSNPNPRLLKEMEGLARDIKYEHELIKDDPYFKMRQTHEDTFIRLSHDLHALEVVLEKSAGNLGVDKKRDHQRVPIELRARELDQMTPQERSSLARGQLPLQQGADGDLVHFTVGGTPAEQAAVKKALLTPAAEGDASSKKHVSLVRSMTSADGSEILVMKVSAPAYSPHTDKEGKVSSKLSGRKDVLVQVRFKKPQEPAVAKTLGQKTIDAAKKIGGSMVYSKAEMDARVTGSALNTGLDPKLLLSLAVHGAEMVGHFVRDRLGRQLQPDSDVVRLTLKWGLDLVDVENFAAKINKHLEQKEDPKKILQDVADAFKASSSSAMKKTGQRLENWIYSDLKSADLVHDIPSELDLANNLLRVADKLRQNEAYEPQRSGRPPQDIATAYPVANPNHLSGVGDLAGGGAGQKAFDHPADSRMGPMSLGTHEGVDQRNRGKANQDGFVPLKNGFVIIDGLGGYKGGEQATAVAAQAISATVEKGGGLVRAVAIADDVIHHDLNAAGGNASEAGVVLVGIEFGPHENGKRSFQTVNAGDSKIEQWRRNASGQWVEVFATVEETYAEKMLKMGWPPDSPVATPALAVYALPRIPIGNQAALPSGVVTNRLGGNDSRVKPVISEGTALRGDIFLGASDGAENLTREDKIEAFETCGNDPARIKEFLLNRALEKMQKLKTAYELIKAMPTSEDGTRVQVPGEGPGRFINKAGNVYDRLDHNDPDSVLIDHYKCDNITMGVYVEAPKPVMRQGTPTPEKSTPVVPAPPEQKMSPLPEPPRRHSDRPTLHGLGLQAAVPARKPDAPPPPPPVIKELPSPKAYFDGTSVPVEYAGGNDRFNPLEALALMKKVSPITRQLSQRDHELHGFPITQTSVREQDYPTFIDGMKRLASYARDFYVSDPLAYKLFLTELQKMGYNEEGAKLAVKPAPVQAAPVAPPPPPAPPAAPPPPPAPPGGNGSGGGNRRNRPGPIPEGVLNANFLGLGTRTPASPPHPGVRLSTYTVSNRADVQNSATGIIEGRKPADFGNGEMAGVYFEVREGKLYLVDERPPRPSDGPLRHRDATFSINGIEVPKNSPVLLRAGDVILSSLFNLTTIEPMPGPLETMPQDRLQRIAGRVARASEVSDLVPALGPLPPKMAEDPVTVIRDVLNGFRNVQAVPQTAGLRDWVIQKMRRTMDEERLQNPALMADAVISHDLHQHPVQREYRAHQELKEVSRQMDQAATLSELTKVFADCNLTSFGGWSKGHLVTTLTDISEGSFSGIVNLPAAIRRKAQRLVEVMAHQRGQDDLKSLHDGKARIWDSPFQVQTASSQMRCKSLVEKHWQGLEAQELQEKVYQVLEREKPLELITRDHGLRQALREEMQTHIDATLNFLNGEIARLEQEIVAQPDASPQREKLFNQKVDLANKCKMLEGSQGYARNPYTGEVISNHQIRPTENPEVARDHFLEDRYHLAKNIQNEKTGLPINGMPSPYEVSTLQTVCKLVYRRNVADYLEAQKLIRERLEAGDTSIMKWFEQASAPDKALVFETYFGTFHHRPMPDKATAINVATLLGAGGGYREVGVTFSNTGSRPEWSITRGAPDYVSQGEPGHHFFMHTHPEEYVDLRKAHGKKPKDDLDSPHTMAQNHKSVRSGDSRNIMPSDGDVNNCINDARTSFKVGKSSPAYDAAGRVFRNYVLHPFGGNEVKVFMGKTGKPEKVVVNYALNKTAAMNGNYKDVISYLKQHMADKHPGLPIEFHEIPLAQLKDAFTG